MKFLVYFDQLFLSSWISNCHPQKSIQKLCFFGSFDFWLCLFHFPQWLCKEVSGGPVAEEGVSENPGVGSDGPLELGEEYERLEAGVPFLLCS